MVENQGSYRAAAQQAGSMTSFAVNTHQDRPGFWDSLLPSEPTFPQFDATASQNPFSQLPATGGHQSVNSGLPPWGSSTAQEHSQAFPVNAFESSSDGSETSSDDDCEMLGTPGIQDLSSDQAGELLFYQYRRARKAWRRFTGRPVRRFRRKFKKVLGWSILMWL